MQIKVNKNERTKYQLITSFAAASAATILAATYTPTALAEVTKFYPKHKTEFELGLDFQLDGGENPDCEFDVCAEFENNLRILDASLGVSHYFGTESALKLGLNASLEKEKKASETIRAGLLPESPLLSKVMEPDSDNLDNLSLGWQYKTFDLSIVRNMPLTSQFTTSENNYSSYRLSAFNDERVGFYDPSQKDALRASHAFSSVGLYAAVGIKAPDSRVDLDHELRVEFNPIPNIAILDYIETGISLRQVSDNLLGTEYVSWGVDFRILHNVSTDTLIGYSSNEIGDYLGAEIAHRYDERIKLIFGASSFRADDNDNSEFGVNFRDVDHLFANFSLALSSKIHFFAEMNHLDTDDTRDNKEFGLLGIRYQL